MEKATLNIGGMHCGSCATSIQMYLSTQDGVVNATVDYNAKKADVEYDSSKISLDKITGAVTELGFTANKA